MSPQTAAQAEREADRLRDELATTLEQLSDNLAPRQLAAEAASAVADRTPSWLKDYWRLARGPVGLGIVGASAARLALSLTGLRRRR